MKDKLADKLTPPASDTPEKPFLTESELKRFVAVCEKLPIEWQSFMMIAMETGMRPEEVLGLHWSDIDEGTREVSIQRAIQYVDKETFKGSLKNKSSYRKVQVSKGVIALLNTWGKKQAEMQLKMGKAWIDKELIFTTEFGGPRLPTTASTKGSDIFKAAKIDGGYLYILRHTSITRMLAAGVPAPNVAAYHGHSSTKMALDVYGHAAENYASSCSAVMELSQFKTN